MKKMIFIILALMILIFWGDVVFGLLIHALEIVLETLELLIENFLEAAFSLELHEAQAVTAWLGLGVFTLLLVLGLRKLNRLVRHWKISAPVWWEEEAKVTLKAMRVSHVWPLVLMVIVVLLAMLFF